MRIRSQEDTNLIAKDGVVLKERKQLKMVIDVSGVTHHDDAAERLGRGDALVIDGKGIERAVWNIAAEGDDAQLDVG